MATSQGDPVTAFGGLPTRLYLDTSTLQAVFDYGDLIWENEEPVLSTRAEQFRGFGDELEALRRIFVVNQRAMFEFVVTAASLREVERKNDPRYVRWVDDVLDTWLIQSQGREPHRLKRDRIGSVSLEDWALLTDAMDNDCDAFLTMEGKLTSQADVIDRLAHIKVMRPSTYWGLLEPWANLYL